MFGNNTMKRWITDNLDLTLDKLGKADADKWLSLAENDTRKFLKLAEHGLKLRRRRHLTSPPTSQKELNVFLLEFRCKVQLAHDQFAGLPPVVLFDFGGEAFIYSDAFRQATLRYTKVGGRA